MGQPLAAPLFGKDNLPVDFDPELGGNAWAFFHKKEPTKALRINGTFRVVTIHGGEPQVCDDGWLALDSQGHPYPIDSKVFEGTFEPIPQGQESAVTLEQQRAASVEAADGLRSRLGGMGFETSDGSDDPSRRDLLLALDVYLGEYAS